jgi:hypothetical protein
MAQINQYDRHELSNEKQLILSYHYQKYDQINVRCLKSSCIYHLGNPIFEGEKHGIQPIQPRLTTTVQNGASI